MMMTRSRNTVGVVIGAVVMVGAVVAWRLNPDLNRGAVRHANPVELLVDPSFELGGDVWHVGNDSSFTRVRFADNAHVGRRSTHLSKDQVVFQNVDVGAHTGGALRGSAWIRGGSAELHVRTNCGAGVPVEETVTGISAGEQWVHGSATLVPSKGGCSLRLELASRGEIDVDDVSLVDPRFVNPSFEEGSAGWAGPVDAAARHDSFDGDSVGVLRTAARVWQAYMLDPSMEEYVAQAQIAVRRGAGSVRITVHCPGLADRTAQSVPFGADPRWREIAAEFRETTARIQPGAVGCALEFAVAATKGTEIDGATLELRTGPSTNGGGESHVGEDESGAVPRDVGGVANQRVATTVLRAP